MLRIKTLLCLCLLALNVRSELRFANVRCKEFHPEFASFEICRIKMIRRGVSALNIHVKLHQIPVTNVSVNLSLYKKANAFQPFLYNNTGDFCAFQRNRKRMPFLNIFFNAFMSTSNINHTCPFDHDIIVENLVLKEEMFRMLPIPNGEYMFNLKVGAYNDWKADVKVYIVTRTKFGE
ncbi:uncharacterized protein LOC109613179 [Musca domestica]|uniref:Uncharacterized protein LOC109613179 n=1 Tax=Musca domestica TaxID=7370 RepID=A0A9J7IDV5_MUSDO|nr:uncharacterized protein LOC109613179 [Musca domestica]